MNPRRRTVGSFVVLFLAGMAFILFWRDISTGKEKQGIPSSFRQVFEFNGTLWSGLFRPEARNECAPPPRGKPARVNGSIGLQKNIPLSQWTLRVDEDPSDSTAKHLSLKFEDLEKLPRTEISVRFYCIEGWSEGMSFAGVKFSDFVKAYHLKTKPYVGLESVDRKYYVSLDLKSMMHDQTLLAYEQNGEPLTPRHGAPLRLAVPTKYGIKNIKQIGRIFFSDRRPPDYWAERGYDWHAGL